MCVQSVPCMFYVQRTIDFLKYMTICPSLDIAGRLYEVQLLIHDIVFDMESYVFYQLYTNIHVCI
jgi:hypothetical protein